MNDDKNLSSAPGVTKEVEDLVDDYGDARARLKRWVLDGNVRRCETAGNEVTKTRTALLAAIEKYGKQQRKEGWDDCLADEFEERAENRKESEDWL